MINELTSGSEYSRSLLKQTIFYIVPIINPDGVIGGYSRSTSTGVNVEVNWDRTDSLTTPEVKVLKKKLTELTSVKPMDLLLNMHSQIANSATYWIHTAESTSGKTYRNQLLLSNLTINDNPYYTSKDQSFSEVAPRYAEGWIWNRFGDKTVAITFETPYTFYKEDLNSEWVSVENLSKMAMNSLYAISDFLNLSTSNRILANPLPINKHRWISNNVDSEVFFGDQYYKATSVRSKVKICVPDLKKGLYRVFTWIVGPTDKISPADTNFWKEIGTIYHKKDGKLVWRTRVEMPGKTVNKILLVK
jgi:hypothetical protein